MTTGGDTLKIYPIRTVEFKYNLTQEDVEQYSVTSSSQFELTSNGYIYDSFVVNGVEHAEPLSDIIDTAFGPIYVENESVEVIHNLDNPLPYNPSTDIVCQFDENLTTNNPYVLFCMDYTGMGIVPNFFAPLENLMGIMDYFSLNGNTLTIRKEFVHDILMRLAETGDEATLELFASQVSFYLLFSNEMIDGFSLEGAEIIPKDILYNLYGDQLLPLTMSYTTDYYDSDEISFTNKNIAYAHDFSITFERPLVDDDYFIAFGQVLKVSSDLAKAMWKTDDNQTFYPNIQFVEKIITMMDTHYLVMTDMDGNEIKYQLHYRTGGVPQHVYCPLEVGKIDVIAELASTLYVENANDCVVGALYEFWAENDYKGYVTSPLLPYQWMVEGSGGVVAYNTALGLEEIVLPRDITFIPGCFAERSTLRKVNIPPTVKKILGYAFNSCTNLEEIKLPESLEIINNDAFRNTGLKSVTIPGNVKTIGEYAFAYCHSLTSVTLSDGVTSLGYNMFMNCSNLATITSYASIAPTINQHTFYNMPSNGVLRVPTGSNYSSWLSNLPSGWSIEYFNI